MSKSKPLPPYITTVENEYDNAMREQAAEERKDPVGFAIRQLQHHYRSNRFNSCYSYGDALSFYMKQDYWSQIEVGMKEKSLPSLAEYELEKFAYTWKLRKQLVQERPKLARTCNWYVEYLKLSAEGII